MQRWLIALVLGAAITPVLGTAHGAEAPASRSRVQTILNEAGSVADLRARLLDRAVASVDSVPAEAGEAFYYVGRSWAREGRRDSAIAALRRAVVLRGATEERVALADHLMLRAGLGDAAAARALIAPLVQTAIAEPELGSSGIIGRLAWAHHLAGHADSAAILFAQSERQLRDHMEWRYRMARVNLDRGDARKAIELLTPLATATRHADGEVMEMISEAASKTGRSAQTQSALVAQLSRWDQQEQQQLDAWGARRVAFSAPDGFQLGGVVMAPGGSARRRAAVILMDPSGVIEELDSLVVGLARHGLAAIVLELRGTGRSVSPTLPLPEAWRGREAELHRRSARDVPAALRALAQSAKIDTSTYLVVGVGPTASIAVEAAELDTRIGLLLLVAPNPDPVERGAMRARIEAMRIPVYLQNPAGVRSVSEVSELLYRAGDPRASRLSDAETPGTGASLYHYDPRLLARFKAWLEDSWPRRARRPNPQPGTRRTG